MIVVDALTGERLPGIPTPRLIQQGSGKAYFSPNDHEASRERIPGVWYLYVPGQYEDPAGQYRRVRVVDEETMRF